MARVYKKPLYRPVPTGARIVVKNGKKIAHWTVGGQECSAEYVETKNGPRIVVESEYFIARYTDATGRFRERSTGCRDQRAAEHKLNGWLREIEKVKAGILSQEEFEVGRRLAEPIEKHLVDFEQHLKAKGATARYIRETLSRIRKVCDGCKFERMADMTSTGFLRWLNRHEGMGPRTRNGYREVMQTFSNWAVKSDCLSSNPFQKVPKARESAERRHQRRALNVEEVGKLLQAAQDRPIHELTLIRKGTRAGTNGSKVRETVKTEARRLGTERKLLYATMIYTGLRKSELASLTVGQVFPDHDIPHLVLAAKDEKARRGATLPLHPELAAHLRDWVRDRSPSEKLFRVPGGLDKILNRDLAFAGISKRDALDRVIDVHALRHTHATLLAQRGVSPTVAKSSMRHSDVRLTLNVYSHLELGDIAEGVNRLPDLLGGES